MDDQGFIIVADSGNNRIQIFTAGKTKLKRKINRHIIYKICYKIIIVIFKTDGGFVTSFGMTHTNKNFPKWLMNDQYFLFINFFLLFLGCWGSGDGEFKVNC